MCMGSMGPMGLPGRAKYIFYITSCPWKQYPARDASYVQQSVSHYEQLVPPDLVLFSAHNV